jgi:hypothetical protein
MAGTSHAMTQALASAEISFQNIPVDLRQRLEIGERDAFVNHVHGRADETKFDDRTLGADEARIGRAA